MSHDEQQSGYFAPEPVQAGCPSAGPRPEEAVPNPLPAQQPGEFAHDPTDAAPRLPPGKG